MAKSVPYQSVEFLVALLASRLGLKYLPEWDKTTGQYKEAGVILDYQRSYGGYAVCFVGVNGSSGEYDFLGLQCPRMTAVQLCEKINFAIRVLDAVQNRNSGVLEGLVELKTWQEAYNAVPNRLKE